MAGFKASSTGFEARFQAWKSLTENGGWNQAQSMIVTVEYAAQHLGELLDSVDEGKSIENCAAG